MVAMEGSEAVLAAVLMALILLLGDVGSAATVGINKTVITIQTAVISIQLNIPTSSKYNKDTKNYLHL